MFELRDLPRPVIVAPMAGGPSTPELVAAADDAGGLGFLAAGYRSGEQMRAQIAEARRLGAQHFGVNVFVPEAEPVDMAAARAYRERLAPLAESLHVALPDPRSDDDAYEEKVAALLDERVPVVSFTFGCPSPEVVRAFARSGTYTIASVTTGREAAQADAAGVDALVAQGPEAGGHRATFRRHETPSGRPLHELIAQVRAATALPVIAAGGLGTPSAVAAALTVADAVQAGTAFLDAEEAGTGATYRRALRDPRYTETAVTRAFSGRWARGLRNRFIDEFGADAPAAYPAVNQVTAPLRKAAAEAGDAERLSLWAGTAWRSLRSGPAAPIIDALLADTE